MFVIPTAESIPLEESGNLFSIEILDSLFQGNDTYGCYQRVIIS